MIFDKKKGDYQIGSGGLYFLTLTTVQCYNLFKKPAFIDIFVNSIKRAQEKKGLSLFAYVIMHDHVHLIAETTNQHLDHVIEGIKQFTSKRIIAKLMEWNNVESEHVLSIFEKHGTDNPRNKTYQVWIQDNQPVELGTHFLFDQKLEYIHMNPVIAGMVSRPEDYQYSSVVNYKTGKGLLDIMYV